MLFRTEWRIESNPSGFWFTKSSQSGGGKIGHSHKFNMWKFLQRAERLHHGHSSARGTKEARSALASTYRQALKKY
jgi:hypothetical protein